MFSKCFVTFGFRLPRETTTSIVDTMNSVMHRKMAYERFIMLTAYHVPIKSQGVIFCFRSGYVFEDAQISYD
jgi:hypothetical protein